MDSLRKPLAYELDARLDKRHKHLDSDYQNALDLLTTYRRKGNNIDSKTQFAFEEKVVGKLARKLINFESELSSEIRDTKYVRELTGRVDFLIKSYTHKEQ